jgi:hypothetical protein
LAEQLVKIVKGSLDGNEIQNAASEHTLKELLAAINRMEKNTGPSSKKATKELDTFTKKTKESTRATEELSEAKRTLTADITNLTRRGFGMLMSGIGSITSGLLNLSGQVFNFGMDMIESQATVTDFTASLERSSFNILGLGTAVHRLTQLIYGNYRSFQTLSQSGIALGDRISSLQSDFASMGIDAQTLTSALADNAHLFALYGSASTSAARALDGMRQITGDTREELMRFGLSFEEQAEIFVATYARNTRALRMGLVTTDQINEQSARYARSLRTIAEMTGTTARELEEQQRRVDMEQAFQLYLDSLDDPNVANQIRASVAAVGALLNDGGRDMAMAQAMGTIATTDAAISLQAFGSGMTEYVNDMLAIARNTTLSEEDRARALVEASRRAGQAQTLAQTENLALAQQLIFGGESVVNDILRFFRLTSGTVDEIQSRFGDVDVAGESIMTLDRAIVAVRTGFSDLATRFFANDTVQEGIASFTEWIGSFAEWVETANFDDFNPITEEGRANIIQSFMNLASTVGTALTDFWNGPHAVSLRNSISGFFESLVEHLILAIYDTTGLMGGTAESIRDRRVRAAIEAGQPLTPDLQAHAAMREQQEETAHARDIRLSRLRGAMYGRGAGTPGVFEDTTGDSSGRIQRDREEFDRRVSGLIGEFNRVLDFHSSDETLLLDRLLRVYDEFNIASRSFRDTPELLDHIRLTEQQIVDALLAHEQARQIVLGRQDIFPDLVTLLESNIISAEEMLEQGFEQIFANMTTYFHNSGSNELRDALGRVVDPETAEAIISSLEEPPATRRIGTLNATGMRFEPRDTVAQIHAGERVLNPQETTEYNTQSLSQTEMLRKLDQLNTTMSMVASLMQQEITIQTRTMRGVTNMVTDLNRGIPI